MAVFTATRAGAIFGNTTIVGHLQAATTETGEVLEVGWAGEATATGAARTRLTRASALGSGTPGTSLSIQQSDMHGLGAGATPLLESLVSYATPPTLLSGGSLLPLQSWNFHGGIVRWLAGPGERMIITGAVLTIYNESGSGTGSAGFKWLE